jgi:septum formation protein
MLRFLSGKTHIVLTGVCLLSNISETTFFSETLVTFKELKDMEIVYYIDNFNPYDKAGSYGIQEWIGYIGVEQIKGSYYNVMGLPVQKLYTELIKFLNINITE